MDHNGRKRRQRVPVPKMDVMTGHGSGSTKAYFSNFSSPLSNRKERPSMRSFVRGRDVIVKAEPETKKGGGGGLGGKRNSRGKARKE